MKTGPDVRNKDMKFRDARPLLPPGWAERAIEVTALAAFRDYPRTPVLSREAPGVTHITRGRVAAAQVKEHLPWLYELYRTKFRELGSEAWGEPLDCADDDRYGVVLNVQQGREMRFECHVDSNPVTGLLFLTTHPTGGELVIGTNPDAVGLEAIEEDCTVISPVAGHLLFFDGLSHPHYARPLIFSQNVRVAAVMNFYTAAVPESARPAELNPHLFGSR